MKLALIIIGVILFVPLIIRPAIVIALSAIKGGDSDVDSSAKLIKPEKLKRLKRLLYVAMFLYIALFIVEILLLVDTFAPGFLNSNIAVIIIGILIFGGVIAWANRKYKRYVKENPRPKPGTPEELDWVNKYSDTLNKSSVRNRVIVIVIVIVVVLLAALAIQRPL